MAKAKSLFKQLEVAAHSAHGISRSTKNGTYIFRKSFFYRSGGTTEKFEENISNQLTAAGFKFEVVSSGEVDKPFRGGGSIKQNSHWYVEVKISTEE